MTIADNEANENQVETGGKVSNKVEICSKDNEIQEDVLPKKKLEEMSPEELISKGRAPVKREFLVISALKPVEGAEKQELGDSASDPGTTKQVASGRGASGEGVTAGGVVTVEHKSKRQMKRERQEAKRSGDHICAAVARTGSVSGCKYGASCRFNHDLEGFLALKQEDIPGQCPFYEKPIPCPYGISCRFLSTHKTTEELEKANVGEEEEEEKNVLKKETQKKLWKNVLETKRADEKLADMGLLGKARQRIPKISQIVEQKEESLAEKRKSELEGDSVDSSKKPRLEGNGKEVTAELEEDKKNCTSTGRQESLHLPKTAEITSKTAETLPNSDETEPRILETRGVVGEDEDLLLPAREKKVLDLRGQIYLAPLTTVGNLPFRRVCKNLGADVTCGEMAMCSNLLQGQASEWALLRRHVSEETFGVQICGSHPDQLARTAEVIERECDVSFIDINMGCPIDLVVNKGAGSCLLTKPLRMEQCVRATSASIDGPLTVKVRTAYFDGRNCIYNLIPQIYDWGASAVTIHGRSRQQRYSKLADWQYVDLCAQNRPTSSTFQIIGNGDIFSYTDWNEHLRPNQPGVDTCMVARGALIKPWLLTEIKEQRHWDISASERLDILKDFVRFGLQHWGSDNKGVETTRHFLLEWLGYLHRYIPVGLLEVVPQKLNWRPPRYYGRSDLETLLASDSAADWVRISERLLGPAPPSFRFIPKHKSNAYDKTENG